MLLHVPAPSAAIVATARAVGNVGMERLLRSQALQAKLTFGSSDVYEEEADRVAEAVVQMAAPVSEMHSQVVQRRTQTAGAETSGAEVSPERESIIDAQRGGGQPLSASLLEFMEPRFGHNFRQVRVHNGPSAAEQADSLAAQAFTVGRDIVFAAGRFDPTSAAGRTLLAHELTHVVQQGYAPALPAGGAQASSIGKRVVQRHAALDPRLPANRAEAIRFAADSKIAIDVANARLASAAEPRLRNVPAFIAQQGLRLDALTPRHDSVAAPGRIRFFAGQTDYSDSVQLPADATHHIDAAHRGVRIRARVHDDVDTLLTGPNIEERLVQAVSEVADTSAARRGAPELFEVYRAQFNALWSVAEFASISTSFAPTLNSKGPRTQKSRQVFERIYQDDSALSAAYDTNRDGIRERVDSYAAPESFNPLNSPRLQKLREVFFRVPMPIPGAAFAVFRAALVAAAAGLDAADREAVDHSEDWQRLINAYVTTDDRRAELRTIIRTPTAAPTSPVAAAPAPSGPRQIVTPQTEFVDGVTIEGPTAPVVANKRRAQVRLTPRSTVANPGVAIDSRFTVTPANRVAGSNVSPDSPWTRGADSGAPFSPEITNSSTVTMTAHLDLVNEPGGLAPAAPIPDLSFTVQDERQAHFVATWDAAASFDDGSAWQRFDPGRSMPRYHGGTLSSRVFGFLPQDDSNPGLTLFIKIRMKRDATVLAAPAPEPFPPDARTTAPIWINTLAPDAMATGVDPLTFEVDLLAADRSTVLSSKTIEMNILAEQTYTKAQAIAEATADEAHLLDTGPSGLLGQMMAKGGAPAMVAAAISATTQPKITLKPLTRRHDSRRYVTAVIRGHPHPEIEGYFVGTTYNDTPPDSAHSFASVPGAAAFFLPDGFGPRFIVANVTADVGAAPPVKRSDDNLIVNIVHEAVHAMDVVPHAETALALYKTEFRAYWMEGEYGPPEGTCPPPSTPFTTLCAPTGCLDTAFRPELPLPGPKSCRARGIFRRLYGSTAYPFVRAAYDNNVAGFREAVDNYLVPDGINLVVSRRLESLRELIEGFSGKGFASFRARVQEFVGIGPAPAAGILTGEEWNEVKRNRAWRDLVDLKISNAADRALIKADLWIPR